MSYLLKLALANVLNLEHGRPEEIYTTGTSHLSNSDNTSPEILSFCTPRVVDGRLGDLVIKIVEHFLPLFVGSNCAAPYLLDFCNSHPENVLGFLLHELEYTHLCIV